MLPGWISAKLLPIMAMISTYKVFHSLASYLYIAISSYTIICVVFVSVKFVVLFTDRKLLEKLQDELVYVVSKPSDS